MGNNFGDFLFPSLDGEAYFYGKQSISLVASTFPSELVTLRKTETMKIARAADSVSIHFKYPLEVLAHNFEQTGQLLHHETSVVRTLSAKSIITKQMALISI